MRQYALRLFCALIFLIRFAPFTAVHAVWAAARPAEQLAVLFIIDDSGSMKENDPANRRYAAAALFVAALDAGDRVGVLRFSTGSQPVTEGLVTITGEHDKDALIGLLSPVPADGYTDVRSAFQTARAMLGATSLETFQTVVIFLTDGKPEVPQMAAGYTQDALAAAKALGVPVYAVALTPQGQTNFLVQLAAETGGKVIHAASADDLIDSYLSILGELKDRTVLGQAGGAIQIDPGLAPYIRGATFIAIHPHADQVWLVWPDGSETGGSPSLPGLSHLRITPVTVEVPMPGAWSFRAEAGGEVPVRAIFHARLRAAVTAPTGWVEAGQPVTITAELMEEQAGGEQVTILGDAAFSARIYLPDGRQESLDSLVDDGSHGDRTAGDGVFSRLYPNTAQPGLYRLELLGRKGQIPVRAEAWFEVVALPALIASQPDRILYELRGETVPLAVRLSEDPADRFIGAFLARVTAPSGVETVVPLVENGQIYEGAFTPVENGTHTVTYQPAGAAYLGIDYRHEASAMFTARLVPALTVTGARLAANRDSYEMIEAREGVGVELELRSTSLTAEPVLIRVNGAPGFSIREPMPVTVPPGESTLMLHLAAEPGVTPGRHNIHLEFTPVPVSGAAADLINQAQPLAITLYEPAVTARVGVITGCLPGRCWQQAPVRIILHTTSTSARAEQLTLRLEGMPGAALSRATIEVPPGQGQVEVEIRAASRLASGDYSAALVLSGARDGLSLASGTVLPLEFTLKSALQSCQKPLIFFGLAVVAAAMIVIKVARTVRNNAQPPLVKGTLRHWRSDAPVHQQVVDLTALQKEAVTIGSGSHCDIIVVDSGLEEEHARISAERAPGGAVRWIMAPLGRVTAGYRVQALAFELQEQVAYQMGNRVFVFLRDAEL